MRTSSDCLARSPGSHLAGICGDSRPRLSSGPVVSVRSMTSALPRAEPLLRRSEGSGAHLSRATTHCHSDRSRSACDGGAEEPASPRRRTGARIQKCWRHVGLIARPQQIARQHRRSVLQEMGRTPGGNGARKDAGYTPNLDRRFARRDIVSASARLRSYPD
jgi:hypothetical protein